MTRVKRGTTKHKKRERLLRHTKGFRWGRKNKKSVAKEALLHAWTHAFRGRKEKKRSYRRLWNARINAGARQNGMTYGELIHSLKEKNIALDRKILAHLAKDEPEVFKEVVEKLKEDGKK